MRLSVALFLFLVFSAPALGADKITVETLLGYCREAEVVYQSLSTTEEADLPKAAMLGTGYCLGHISAFRDALALGVRLHKDAGFKKNWKAVIRMCIPEKRVSAIELARTFTHWARKHTESRQDPAVLGLYKALQRAYPCVDTAH